MSKEKIRPEHIARPAFVYIRQSTLDQVRHHHESRRRQYDLAGYARTLGWSEVIVIDDDLGKSGASSAGRLGFQRLVAAVSLGQAGGVFGLEVSRLARNNRDWYQLLDLCGLTRALIIDGEGIYDPRLPNDRLLLGLKGTLSEAELGWIRQRAQEGLLAKARRGELLLGVPVGYVRTRDGRLEKHPDRRVQDALGLVFERFAALGSVRQTLLWFREEGIALPALRPEATWGDEIIWRPPVYNTVLHILRNPCYAGAYAFGRTATRTQVRDGLAYKTRGHHRAREEWIVLLRDHHEPYISWEVYERYQTLIAENAAMKGLMRRGAVRRGPSLLAGLLRCGHCGRRLHVTYSGSTGRIPRYSCCDGRVNHGTARCISFGGARVDAAVEHELLRVLAPGAIEAALASADEAAGETAAVRRALELEVREAEYEAERARRQYDAVEPEHRLVAATLEERWNAALERVRTLEQRRTAVAAEAARTSRPDRATLLRLAEEFPAVWADPATDFKAKKQIVRLLVEEIIVRVPEEPVVELVIHWKGGKHTALQVRRNRRGQHGRTTNREIVDVVQELARCQPDGQIARLLNRLGYRTGAGNGWTESRVRTLRSGHGIAVFDPATDETGALTLAQAALTLGVSASTVRQLIVTRVLPATQPVAHAPWSIRPDDLQRETVQRTVEAVKRGRSLPRCASPTQLTLGNSST